MHFDGDGGFGTDGGRIGVFGFYILGDCGDERGLHRGFNGDVQDFFAAENQF